MPWSPKTHEQLLKAKQAAREPRRRSAHQRGYTRRWANVSRAYLEDNPYCAECLRNGRVRGPEVTDHIVPHKGDQELFWEPDNWQPLCKRCHDRKSAKE